MLLLLVSCSGSKDRGLTSAKIKEICLERQRSAEGPTGLLSFSTGTKGSSAGIKLNFHSDYLVGKNPDSVYLDCMFTLNDRFNKV